MVRILGLAALAAVLALPAWAAGSITSGKELAVNAGCVTCHGEDGMGKGPDRPYLAGQKTAYLVKQLTSFRNSVSGKQGKHLLGQRRYAAMEKCAGGLTDDAIKDLAAYFSSLACTKVHRVASISKPKKANRCGVCHGGSGIGRTNVVPNIGGQKAAYLERQLRNLRKAGVDNDPGEGARSHPIMDWQARHLTPEEIEPIAAYFASQSCN